MSVKCLAMKDSCASLNAWDVDVAATPGAVPASSATARRLHTSAVHWSNMFSAGAPATTPSKSS